MSDTDGGDISVLPEGVRDALLQGRWYMERGEQSGFLVIDGPHEPLLPIFSSLAELGRYAGACPWFSTTGEDLIGLLPTGHGLVVDLAGESPQLVPATALDPLRGTEEAGGE